MAIVGRVLKRRESGDKLGADPLGCGVAAIRLPKLATKSGIDRRVSKAFVKLRMDGGARSEQEMSGRKFKAVRKLLDEALCQERELSG